jgi:hypothetical protein
VAGQVGGGDEGVVELGAPADLVFLGGELLGGAQGHAGGQDGHLVHRVGVGQDGGEEGVAGLVVGDGALLVGAEHEGAATEAEEDPVAGGVEVAGVDLFGVAAHGEEGGLVDEVGQLGAAHPGGAPGDQVEVDVGGQAFAPAVDGQDGGAFGCGGQGDDDFRGPVSRPAAAPDRGQQRTRRRRPRRR